LFNNFYKWTAPKLTLSKQMTKIENLQRKKTIENYGNMYKSDNEDMLAIFISQKLNAGLDPYVME
jgi:hypothetical protein